MNIERIRSNIDKIFDMSLDNNAKKLLIIGEIISIDVKLIQVINELEGLRDYQNKLIKSKREDYQRELNNIINELMEL